MLFVLGTKAGVGKTLVAMTLLRLADALGVSVAGMKPVQTGCPYTDDHDLWARDGDVLRASVRRPLPPLVTSPYRFSTPGAPADAARRAGISLMLADLEAAVRAAAAQRALLIVEGAGGLDTAIAEDGTTADLARRLAATTVLVADGDDDLDQVLASAPLAIHAVVLTRVPGPDPRAVVCLPELQPGDDALTFFESANAAAALILPQIGS